MKEFLKAFVEKQPEIVFEWNDSKTDAKGWVVINSLKGGAAGGGTRMRPGLDREEVTALAKTMEIKFTVSGPPIGGAKSGINFDPKSPEKEGVLKRWYKAVSPLLKQYYGTGGDLNIDEVKEVIPITEDCGIWHPQEGIFKGHFHPSEPQIVNRIGKLRQGVIKVIEEGILTPDIKKKYTVADMITGFGVSETVKHYYSIWGGDLSNKRVGVQGWGNVGASAAYYLSMAGAKVVAIIDKVGGVYNEDGFTQKEINDLLAAKKSNELIAENLVEFDEFNNIFWDLPFEIFIPAAASKLVTKSQVERLIQSNTKLISSGANVPFKEADIFYGDTTEYADENLSVIPDFIANSGMARTFAYFMGPGGSFDDIKIFDDVSTSIESALRKTYNKKKDNKQITKTALSIALDQLT